MHIMDQRKGPWSAIRNGTAVYKMYYIIYQAFLLVLANWTRLTWLYNTILEGMASEAPTQRTHLAILAKVWWPFHSPGDVLIKICGSCAAYHMCFPMTWPEGIENPLQRVWSFLFKFHLKNHKMCELNRCQNSKQQIRKHL